MMRGIDIGPMVRDPATGRPVKKAADLLCGAGGTSTGAKRALARLGFAMDLICMNHWPVALHTHARHHPEARHYLQNIANAKPGLIVTDGYLDLFMASPTCTHHSVARGGKPTSDQQRSDPWHILTWLAELDIFNLMIENVWEYTKWGPVDIVTRRPIKENEGQYFEMWTDNIRKFDFEPEYKKLNAANYGSATTRKRFIMLAKKRRRVITWPIISHGKGAAQPWRPARDIIDWSVKGRSIFGRPVPLAPKTLARVLAGVIKFCWPPIFAVMLRVEMERSMIHTIRYNFARRHSDKPDVRRRARSRVRAYAKWLREFRTTESPASVTVAQACVPMLLTLRNNAHGRSLDLPVPALTANGLHVGLVEPFILNRHGDNGGVRAHPVSEPMPAADCRGAGYIVEPFVLSQASGGVPRETGEPLPTAVGGGAIALIAPYYGSGSGETCTSVDEPLPTATGTDRFALVVPITHSDTSNRARDVNIDPLPTLTTAHRGELAFVAAQFSERDGQAPRVHSLDDPLPTICATGHINLVEATGHDILFRMLEDYELGAAMGFDPELVKYEFTGNKTEKVKQIGNAVPVELADACVTALFADESERMEFMEAAE